MLEREGITQVSDPPHPLFGGALKYFVTQDGAAIFDGVIPLWFFADVVRYVRDAVFTWPIPDG